MRAVIQRVRSASITINGEQGDHISSGLVVLLGIEQDDGPDDIAWLAAKIINLRIFDDEAGRLNLSVQDIEGSLMVVSQFTLHASTKKGNRPSWIKAADPDIAEPLYEQFVLKIGSLMHNRVITGEFGAHMEIEMTNDGPVTILIDTKRKE